MAELSSGESRARCGHMSLQYHGLSRQLSTAISWKPFEPAKTRSVHFSFSAFCAPYSHIYGKLHVKC